MIARLITLVLVTLGCAMVAAGPLVRWWYAPAALLPDRSTSAVLHASARDAEIVDIETGERSVEQVATWTYSYRSDTGASDQTTAVFDAYSQIALAENAVPHGDEAVVSEYSERFAIDRVTGELKACCGSMVDDNDVVHSGIGYRFPRHTEAVAYQGFDAVTGLAYPMNYVTTLNISGDEAVEGLQLMQFRYKVPATRLGSETVSGKLFGGKEDVTAERRYRLVRDVFVEPRSGVIVRASTNRVETLTAESSGQPVTVFDATFVSTDDTVKEQARVAKRINEAEVLFTQTAPLALSVAGTLMTAAGIFGFFRFGQTRRRKRATTTRWV